MLTTLGADPASVPMDAQSNNSSEHHFRERFESLLPSIRRRWPELAHRLADGDSNWKITAETCA